MSSSSTKKLLLNKIYVFKDKVKYIFFDVLKITLDLNALCEYVY